MDKTQIEGRRALYEAFLAGTTIDKVYIQEGLRDEKIGRMIVDLKKQGTIISYVSKEILDGMSEGGNHQGVIAKTAVVSYGTVDDILQKAEAAGEDPFLILLDEIEDPHNLGAILRTANVCGAHGVITTKHHAAGVTATVAKASAGALFHTPIARVTNMARTIEDLKKKGIWIACAAGDGDTMYDVPLHGPLALVIGNEGTGVRALVRKHCDYVVAIPQYGQIESLNASVAAGVLSYEVVRQRRESQQKQQKSKL